MKKREEMEIRKTQPRKRGPKPRPKTAPMSKYRRRTANLRERLRMGEINVAFENLRDKLPNPMAQGVDHVIWTGRRMLKLVLNIE